MIGFYVTPCAGNKHIDTKRILLDGPVSWNLTHDLLISSTGHKNAPLLSLMTAPTHGRRQTKGRHHILMDFYRQSLVKGNTYTWGLLRTTGQLLSKQFMQEVTKLSPLMLCSTLYMVKSAKLINKSLSMFSVRSKTVLSNPRQKVPTPLKWIDIFQLHYCFLAFTHLKLQYLCIHGIFWTDLICFKQLSNVLLDLCKISCSGC